MNKLNQFVRSIFILYTNRKEKCKDEKSSRDICLQRND